MIKKSQYAISIIFLILFVNRVQAQSDPCDYGCTVMLEAVDCSRLTPEQANNACYKQACCRNQLSTQENTETEIIKSSVNPERIQTENIELNVPGNSEGESNNGEYEKDDSGYGGSNNVQKYSTETSMSAADLHYKNALERQKAYQQGMQAAANQLVDVGVSIMNDIQQARIRNVAEKNRYISEYLHEVILLDKDCENLYANNNYEAFLIKEKELRKYENYAIDDLNWLIEKEGDSNYRDLKYEIITNQKKRIKQILEHNTGQLLRNQKKLSDREFIREFEGLQVKEIKEFTGKLSTNGGLYNYSEDYNENRRFFYDWVKFLDLERKERTRRILEANKSNSVLSPLWEAIFYLINNYSDPYYDIKTVAEFLNQDHSFKKAMLIWTLQKLDKKEIWYQSNTRLKYVYDDTKLKLLLGDGTEPIYYYDVSQLVKKQRSTPLYKFLNDRDWNYVTNHKDTEANELVKEWVKRDEKLTGKKANKIFEDFLNENQYLSTTHHEFVELIEKEDYNNALSLVKEARMKFPDNYNLLSDESYIYLKIGNNAKHLELLKERTILKPNDPDLYHRIGYYETEAGNIEEANKYYKKALALKPDHYSVLYNMGILSAQVGNIEEAIGYYKKVLALKPDQFNILYNMGNISAEAGNIQEAISYYKKALDINPEHYDTNYELGEIYLNEANKKTKEANEILKNKGDFDKYKEAYMARFKYFRGALACYKIVLKTDDSDEEFREQVSNLQKTVDQLYARFKIVPSNNEERPD